MTAFPESAGADIIAQALGCTQRAVRMRAAREGWPYEERAVRGGWKRHYHVGQLPDDVAGALSARPRPDAVEEQTSVAPTDALARASAKHRAEALRRARIVEDLEEFLRAEGARLGSVETAVATFVRYLPSDEGAVPSARTLFRWRTAYRKSRLVGLIPRQDRCGRKPADWPEEAKSFLKSVWLSPTRRSKQFAIRRVRETAKGKGWELPSDRTLARYLDAIPESIKIRQREGAKAYAQKVLPYIQRDYEQLQVNEVWNSDHCQLDIFVVDERGRKFRPWLTGWQDCKSRRIVGSRVVRQASSDSIVAAFVQAAGRCGLPRAAYMDNGSDYSGRRVSGGSARFRQTKAAREARRAEMRGVLENLGIRPIFAIPGNARAKIIERFFRTMKLEFEKAIETGYVGSNPQERPEGADRARRRGELLTFDEVRELWATYVEQVYNRTPHSGRGMHGRTPNQVWSDAVESGLRERVAQPATLSLLLRQAKQVKRSRQGVCVEHRFFDSPELRGAVDLGAHVIVRYDVDALDTRVHVFSLSGQYLCEAEYIAPTGFLDRSAIAESRRRQKEIRALDEPEIQEVRREQAKLAREQLVTGVPTVDEDAARSSVVEVVRTPFDADARGLVRGEAEARRRAKADRDEVIAIGVELAMQSRPDESDDDDFDPMEAFMKGLAVMRREHKV